MQNNIVKVLLAAGLVTFLSIGGGCCGKKESPKSNNVARASKQGNAAQGAGGGSDKLSDSVKHKILSFTLEGLTDKGVKNWDVQGEVAEAVSENEVKLDNIVAKAYGEESQATITADKGVYNKAQNNIKLRQNVRATIDNTQNANAQIVGINLQGKKDEAAKTQSGKKAVKTVITCDGDVLFDYQNNKAYFNKNVHVDSDDGNSMVADKITVNLEPNSKKISEIVADGNVKMLRGPNVAYSDRAKYMEEDKTVRLSGQPKIVVYDQGDMAKNLLGGGQDASSGNSRSN